MKQLIIIPTTLLLASLLNSCASSSVEVAPSQNSALNSISNSNASTKKTGAMQSSLDNWLKNDWEPTVSKDKEIQKKYMKKSEEKESTTATEETKKTEKVKYVYKKGRKHRLQEYVDKATAYMRAKPNDYNSSNVHALESLPVIGK
jgi:hypothetical protein